MNGAVSHVWPGEGDGSHHAQRAPAVQLPHHGRAHADPLRAALQDEAPQEKEEGPGLSGGHNSFRG